MKRKLFLTIIFTILVILLIVLCIFIINKNILTVQGNSMEPVLNDGSLIWVNRTSEIKRGEIIVFKKEIIYVKRAVAIEGDTVVITNGKLFVNNNLVREIEDKIFEVCILIPSNAIYVLGDNDKYSYDSRDFGYVFKDELIGKVK